MLVNFVGFPLQLLIIHSNFVQLKVEKRPTGGILMWRLIKNWLAKR